MFCEKKQPERGQGDFICILSAQSQLLLDSSESTQECAVITVQASEKTSELTHY